VNSIGSVLIAYTSGDESGRTFVMPSTWDDSLLLRYPPRWDDSSLVVPLDGMMLQWLLIYKQDGMIRLCRDFSLLGSFTAMEEYVQSAAHTFDSVCREST
jgi:hypothetical protein